MATPVEQVESYLLRARERDAGKGGGGFRTTREVAEYCGLSMAAARRALWGAVTRGTAEAFDGGASGTAGNPIEWIAKLGPHDQ